MIEQRIKELVNGAIDGELTDAEQAELDEQLMQSEEARRYQGGMMKLDTFLQELPIETFPRELHDEITRNVRLPERSVSSRLSFGDWPAFARYGFPVAAALLLAVGIYQFDADTMAPGNLDQMIGTIAPGNAVELDSYSFRTDGLSSSVDLERRSDTIVLSVELESVQPVELNIDFTSTDLEYDSLLANPQDGLEFFGDLALGIRLRSSGRQNFAVLLRRANDTASRKNEAIRLDYSSDGKVIQQGTLIPRW